MSDGVFEETPSTGAASQTTESEFTDKSIICVDCNQDFVWSAGEQSFYNDKGLENPPKRCKPCKKMKTERLTAIEEARETGRRQRIEVAAECASCGVVTTVPFFPSQGRPVFCRSCFRSQSDSANGAGA
jgi:CxxC-x17-CxxC domain-containing protein